LDLPGMGAAQFRFDAIQSLLHLLHLLHGAISWCCGFLQTICGRGSADKDCARTGPMLETACFRRFTGV